MSGRREALYRK